jgi:hypothetical protein
MMLALPSTTVGTVIFLEQPGPRNPREDDRTILSPGCPPLVRRIG